MHDKIISESQNNFQKLYQDKPQEKAIELTAYNIRFRPTVLAKVTSAGWVSSEGEDIQKAAKRFLKQAGGVTLQERSPTA